MWFFCIGTAEPEYPAAMLAVAVADQPAGPFRFLGQRNSAEEHGWGQDLGLFQDIDGQGYLVYDDGHRNLRVDLLAGNCLSSSGWAPVHLWRRLPRSSSGERSLGRKPAPICRRADPAWRLSQG